jgi:Ca-activated chloride channel family protein
MSTTKAVMKRTFAALAITLFASLNVACSGDDDATEGGGFANDPPGATGVTQGGSQDFGLFRQILEAGQIPGPGTLDEIGFFAEHKLDYPAPDCGDDLCMHGLYGAMGNMIDGSNCTLIQVGLNSPIDPAAAGRPPMHLVIAVDTSGSMKGDPITYLRAGLQEMIAELQPEDQISLISYAGWAQVRLEAVSAQDDATLRTAFDQLAAAGSTNLYEGLFAAFRLAETHFDPTRQNRVIFMSDGEATAGLQDPVRLRALATSYAKLGISLTTIGVGTGFDVDAMRGLGEVGAGNFYFLEDPSAVREVFRDEVKTFLFPVALDARIGVSVASGYDLRAAYGTTGFKTYGAGGFVDIPALFLAGRTSADEPIQEGRRGGGGAIMLELVAKPETVGSAPADLGSVSITWRHPTGGQLVTQTTDIVAPHAPGEAPADGWFSHETVEKGFVMLNLYAAFELAVQLSYDSDPRTARRTLEALRPNVKLWLDRHPDPDINDDLRYVDMFIRNLGDVIARTQPYQPADPPNPWPAD